MKPRHVGKLWSNLERKKMTDALLPVIKEQQLSIVASVEALKIDIANPDTAEKAGFYLGKVKAAQKDLDALRKSLTKPLDDKKKDIMEAFRDPEKTLSGVEAHLKGQLLKWSAHLEDIRRKEQAELERKAKEQQEKARAMLEAEAKAKLEEDPFAFDEVEAIEAEAATLCVPTPILPERKTIPFNASKRLLYKWRVKDMDAVPREYLMLDEKKLGEVARAAKGEAEIPGIEFYTEEILTARSA